jgi:signal transduction histidine kinase
MINADDVLPATILNVDDDQMVLYVRTHALERAGFKVIEADRGSKVIPLIATYQPDLVLLDVHLPDANGYDICREIKADPLYASTIVVQTSSSTFDRRERLQGFAAGADSYFLEPMEPEELVANVTALLRLQRVERDLRRSALEWQKTFDSVHDGVAIVQENGYISRCNTAFCEVLGRNCTGESLHEILSVPADQITAGRKVDFERDGRTLRLSIDPVIDHLGQTTHFACIINDVTSEREIARLNERLTQTVEHLKRANEVADAASRAKDEFLATLSHELRTPMTSIIGWAQMMRMFGKNQVSAEEASDAILASARAQSQLVEDLLDLSRITTGKLRLQFEPLELGEVVEAAIQTVVPAAAAKRLTINRDIESVRILGDRDRLQQVVWNLMSNAVKFTPENGRIDVRLEVHDRRATIVVSDTGRGIDPAFLPAVFDRFSQAENVASRATGGLGLGLAIVRSIVELHGGEVGVESKGAGTGATFRVTFPVTDKVAMRDDTDTEMPGLYGRRILVVDDSKEALSMFTSFLRAAGATVFPASSVREALVIDAAEKIDAVVTDLSMPHETGFELIKTIRENDQERTIIAISALPGDIREEVLATGANELLEKPFSPADLVRILAR